MSEAVGLWMARAENHLKTAAVLLEVQRPGTEDAACYHAHEAVAMYLKALLTWNGIQAARTHDLEYQHSLLRDGQRLAVAPQDLAYLSTYGIDRLWEPDWTQARRTLEIAESFRREVEARLK
ncbi:MAG: HEPN domain-containing protein [Acidobacteria bacterium]|nr:HEPN domain-containing protein [Acidobacteriota bacterium]